MLQLHRKAIILKLLHRPYADELRLANVIAELRQYLSADMRLHIANCLQHCRAPKLCGHIGSSLFEKPCKRVNLAFVGDKDMTTSVAFS